jgi:hypothetical protein
VRSDPKFRMPFQPFFRSFRRIRPIAWAGTAAGQANLSKMNGMPMNGCALRGLARMLLGYLQKGQQLHNKQREGNVQMPAHIQLIS